MQYPDPIGRDERMRRKWWRFVVANGWVTPAKRFEGTVTHEQARRLKKLSACNGEGSQFDYSARNKFICGYFREKNINQNFNYHETRFRLWQFESLLLRWHHKKNLKLNDDFRKIQKKKYRKEIRYTYHAWRTLQREDRLLNKLDNALRSLNGLAPRQRYTCFSIGSQFLGMFLTIEEIKQSATIDLHYLYFQQITILQKLISKRK